MKTPFKTLVLLLGLGSGLLLSCLARAENLTYLFMPAEQQTQPQSMLVMMHGYGANEQDFNDFPVIVPSNMIVVSLRAPLPVAGDSYQWYRSGSQEAADVRTSSQEVEATVKTLQQQYHISPSHTYIGGFSQGAVMTYAVSLNAPQLFHGAVIFSGRLPAGINTLAASDAATQQLQAFVGHGEADPRIPLAHARQAVAMLSQRVGNVTFKTYPGMGHTISLDEIKDFRQWLFGQQTP